MSNIPVVTGGLTFADDFSDFTASGDGSVGTWMTQFPFGGEAAFTLPPNHEAEYYSSKLTGNDSPFKIVDGVLNITASPSPVGSNPYNLPFTSGLITTDKSFAQTYGYFEVRAKLPAGQGIWPAFWLLPVQSTDSTELDVFEQVGSSSTIFSTTHGSSGQSQAFNVPDTSLAFHTYGVDWEPTTITFYMDGLKLGSTPTPASMNTPMYMLLNLAIGGQGSWPGAPSAATTFPATMQIDYVHAYATAATSSVIGKASYSAPIASALGIGPNTLSLVISEDAYLGDAQFTISIDGHQIGGLQTAMAAHAAGVGQTYKVNGSFATGVHTVSVNFVNDLYAGSAVADRNLYVTSVSLDGRTMANGTLSLLSNGSQSVQFYEASSNYRPTSVIGSGKDVLALQVSEDAYLGDSQFTISVDGNQVGGIQTATASHTYGETQAFDVLGSYGSGAHTISINFLNDAYGGSASADRNLYVQSATINNISIEHSQRSLSSNGVQSISFQGSSISDTLTVEVSEDAYKGDAQYYILVDGYIAGSGKYAATASHASGQVNVQTVSGNWGNGPHRIGISFLNDASDAGGDRNLYVSSVNFNGNHAPISTTQQLSDGTTYFSVDGTPSISNLTLHLAEDAYLGDAQFVVVVDGTQVGGVETVSASKALGGTQAFNFNAALAAGTHDIAVSFVNDAYGGSSSTDRNLYILGAEQNGTVLSPTSWSATMLNNSTSHFSLVVPAFVG